MFSIYFLLWIITCIWPISALSSKKAGDDKKNNPCCSWVSVTFKQQQQHMKYHSSVEMFYILGQPTDFPTCLASILYDKRFSTAFFSKHLSVDPFPPLQRSHSRQQLCPSSRKGAQPMLTLGPRCTQARGLRGCSNFHPVHVIKLPTQTKSLQDWDQLYPPVANPASKIQLPESTKKFPSQLLRGAWSKPLSYTLITEITINTRNSQIHPFALLGKFCVGKDTRM